MSSGLPENTSRSAIPAATPANNGHQLRIVSRPGPLSDGEGSVIGDVLQVFPRRNFARPAEVPGEAHRAEGDQDTVARIELMRLESHARRLRERMVIVVPAFAHGDEAAAVQ